MRHTDDRTPTGGDPATWTVGAKHGFGTVADHDAADPSRVWYTLTEGAVTEVRFPRLDVTTVRTIDFLITDADGYAVRTLRERRDLPTSLDRSTVVAEDDALAFTQTVTPTDGREWELTVEHAVHPDRDALVLDVDFQGAGYDVYAVMDPALGAHTEHDVATARFEGLTARYDLPEDERAVFRDEADEAFDPAVALTSGSGFDWVSADVRGGDVETALTSGGTSDRQYETATGNVILFGRLDGSATLALGFDDGGDEDGALSTADAALADSFEDTRAAYVDSWRSLLADVPVPDSVADDPDLLAQYNTAVMVLTAADSKRYPGAGIASPSIPWGDAVNADEPGDYGYNFVWGRDLYHTFTAFDCLGDVESALDATEYIFEAQQRSDGFLPQNTFLDGRTRWGGEQLDEIAAPLVMAEQLSRRYDVGFEDASYDYAAVRRSADYLVRAGPHSQQERWEEEAGYSPSTIAAEIAGLVCAASLALTVDERADAITYLGVADHWTDRLETWCATTTGTRFHDRTPYYVRITDEGNPDEGNLRTHNNGGGTLDERNVLDGGFLELVRLGILPADDPVVENTLAEYDEDIMVELPQGPAWYRYTGDGYGEKRVQPGAPWQPDMTGEGRPWPFLTGERGEYELQRAPEDRTFDPESLLRTLGDFANEGRMLPEQVWDEFGENDFDWTVGEGTSSATPLCWTNAQFVRLAWSIDLGEPVETPAAVRERYVDGDRPDGPALDVAIERDGDEVQVTGDTDGDDLVVRTSVDGVHRTCVDGLHRTDGSVSETLSLGEDGRVTVVAATGTLPNVGTTVVRREL